MDSLLIVYETGNMTKAAEKLFITQQCLSKQISSLEKNLGVKLFERRRTGMEPTAVCRRLYPQFKLLSGTGSKIETLCSGWEKLITSEIRIVAEDGLIRQLNYQKIEQALKQSQFASFVIEEHPTKDCYRMLENGEADIGFLLSPVQSMSLEHLTILELRGCLAMPKTHPLAGVSEPINLSEIEGCNFVKGTSSNVMSSLFEEYIQNCGVIVNYVVSISSVSMLAFLNDLTVEDVIVPMLAIDAEKVVNPNVVLKKVADPNLIIRIECCYKHDRPQHKELKDLSLKIAAALNLQKMI